MNKRETVCYEGRYVIIIRGMLNSCSKWGQWSSTEEQKYRQMQYEHGEKCTDSQQRSAEVTVYYLSSELLLLIGAVDITSFSGLL